MRWTARARARNASLHRPAEFSGLARGKNRLYVLAALLWASLVERDHNFAEPEDLVEFLETAEQQLAAFKVIEALIAEAEVDPKIVAVTAAMPDGTGLDIFGGRFPKRTFDVGIAEQHAVTFSAGLATQGLVPFCNIYSSFMLRAYDQVIHDVALQNLNVVFCL